MAVHEVVRLGTKCNFACEFCNVLPAAEKVGEAGFEEAKRRVDQVAGKETSVYISGGEPTLHPYLVELVKYAKSRCKYVVLQTNALLVTRKLAEELRGAGLDWASVNFPSHDPGAFSELTHLPEKMFPKVVKGIRNLMVVPVSLNLVINEKNYRKLKEYLEFAAREFPGVHVRFSAIQPHGRAKENAHLVVDYRKVLPYLKEAIDFARRRKLDILNTNCGMPICMVSGILPLEQNSEFNIGVEARAGEGEFPRLTQDKVKTPRCRDCYLRNLCLGMWEEYYKIRGDIVEPPHRSLRFWPV